MRNNQVSVQCLLSKKIISTVKYSTDEQTEIKPHCLETSSSSPLRFVRFEFVLARYEKLLPFGNGIERANLNLTFISFCSIKSFFNLRIFNWNLKNGIWESDENKKLEQDERFLWNEGSDPPPLLETPIRDQNRNLTQTRFFISMITWAFLEW